MFKLLSSAYPRQNITPEMIELYRLCLAEFDLESVKAAVVDHVKENIYFPTIAELRKAAIDKRATKRLPEPDELEDARIRREAVLRAYEHERLEY